MPSPFNVNAPRSTFGLPAHTKQQIAALMRDLDCDAREIIIIAVAELWQREIGEPDRDFAAEIDAIKAKLGMD